MKYKTNSAATTKSLTEWFFGKDFVKARTEDAARYFKATGKTSVKYFQKGTGFLTIEADK